MSTLSSLPGEPSPRVKVLGENVPTPQSSPPEPPQELKEARYQDHGAEWGGQSGEEGGVEGKGSKIEKLSSSQTRNFCHQHV